MPEIIQVQIGQCGNRAGTKFWRTVCDEHGIIEDGRGIYSEEGIEARHRDILFTDAQNGNYVPRTVFVDLDPDSLADVESDAYGKIFRPEAFVKGSQSAGNIFALGVMRDEGKHLVEEVLETVRREAERCDRLQGFQIVRSIGGGTGSGVGSLVLQKLRAEYGRKGELLSSHIVFPSPMLTDAVIEPYNAILSTSYLYEHDEMTFCYDNDALRINCGRNLDNPTPTYSTLNTIIARAMSGMTVGHRFAGELTSDMTKFAANMVCYPRFKFLLTGFYRPTEKPNVSTTMAKSSSALPYMFEPSCMLASCDPRRGRCFSIANLTVGWEPSLEIKDQLVQIRPGYPDFFSECVPDNFLQGTCHLTEAITEPSVTCAFNTTAILMMFENLLGKFEKLLEKKMFLHWYTGEGMDEGEFSEAAEDVHQLVSYLKEFHPTLNETDSGRQNEEPVVQNGTKKFWFF